MNQFKITECEDNDDEGDMMHLKVVKNQKS